MDATTEMALPLPWEMRNAPFAQALVDLGAARSDVVACLYGSVMRRDGAGELHDRFVPSTGHSAIGLFAVLGALGVYERDELLSYGADGTRIEESPLSGTVDNLVAFVDHNDMQADGRTADIMTVEPVEDRFAAFGWWVERLDGHDVPGLLAAFGRA